jgi:hypothetical protein
MPNPPVKRDCAKTRSPLLLRYLAAVDNDWQVARFPSTKDN